MLLSKEAVAVVTGGGRGLGRAIALDMAREGAQVVIGFVADEAAAEATADEIVAYGGTALPVRVDVTDEESVISMFRAVRRQYDRVDILVNNAGVTRDGWMVTMSLSSWRAVVDVDLTGAFLCSREALKVMARRRTGAIVNVGSVAGVLGSPGQLNYAAAKGGLIAFSRGLAREAARFGVRVNLIAPGPLAGGMGERAGSRLAAVPSAVPLGRLGTLEEAAAAVTFLASDRASYITGAVVPVDGGLSLGG